MPRGIPGEKTAETAEKKLVIVLNPHDLALLEKLAVDNYRTPQLQAAYLLAKVLQEAARNDANNSAERVLQRKALSEEAR